MSIDAWLAVGLFVGGWVMLRLIGNERERLESEMAANAVAAEKAPATAHPTPAKPSRST